MMIFEEPRDKNVSLRFRKTNVLDRLDRRTGTVVMGLAAGTTIVTQSYYGIQAVMQKFHQHVGYCGS